MTIVTIVVVNVPLMMITILLLVRTNSGNKGRLRLSIICDIGVW